MFTVDDWVELKKDLEKPASPSPSLQVTAKERERDRAEIAQIAEELMRREHWNRVQARRYLVELAEAFTEAEKP